MRRWVLEAAIYYVKGGTPFISAVKLNHKSRIANLHISRSLIMYYVVHKSISLVISHVASHCKPVV